MLPAKLGSDIRELWNSFWSGGITNPLTAIEQITYLIFLKRLEDDQSDYFAAPGAEKFRWSYIEKLPGEEKLRQMREAFEWLKTINPDAKERMRDAVFVIPTPNLLTTAMDKIGKLFVPSASQDLMGDIYEDLLKEISVAGKNGQFRTPRHIIRAMCDLVDPTANDKICDPACGTGGFLVNAYQHILKANTSRDILEFEADGTALNLIGDLLSTEQHAELRQNVALQGYDSDATMARLAWMNLIQHGLNAPQIQQFDTLGSRFNNLLDKSAADYIGDFSIILANPPFTGNFDKSDLGQSLKSLNTNKTELLFVELIIQLLTEGGRAAVIVPEGVLFGSTNAHKNLRKRLLEENELKAVISLPGGVFQPYTGVKTSILVFNKGGSTKEVWFYEVQADGYALNAKRNFVPQMNDLWDMTIKYYLRYQPAGTNVPPAFLDDVSWRRWLEYKVDNTASLHFAKPVIEQEQREGSKIDILKGIESIAIPTALTRDWTASIEDIAANDYNLSAGRYKPFVATATEYPDPAELIYELQALEIQIQDGLSKLLVMIEDK